MKVRMLSRAAPAHQQQQHPGTNSSTSSSSSSSSSPFAADFASASSSSFHRAGNGNGVVVVGIVGKDEECLSQLLDRMLDARVFSQRAPGDGGFVAGQAQDGAPLKGSALAQRQLAWVRSRLRHHHDRERGILYVMFPWSSLPVDLLPDEDAAPASFPALLEQQEMAGMRGLFFMFSVCHVILLAQDGARLHPKMLRVFRVLQAAKSAMSSFVKTNVLPSILPSSKVRVAQASSSSPGRGGGRISLMSGSAPTLFPGQCTPVLLFIFVEDFYEHAEGSELSLQVGHSGSGYRRKADSGLRKKFQSSMEAQVRFLIRKCRTVLGFGEVGHGGSGPRGPGSASATGAALFTMDPSRVVLFVERSSSRPCEALEATTRILESLLRGKSSAELALWSPGNGLSEDIQALRDFVLRQAEMLRGRGGNAGGTGGGVGMVAAAAAAAAASAAAGPTGSSAKTMHNPPELPTVAVWLQACDLILGALMTSESESVAPTHRYRSSRKSSAGAPEAGKAGKGVEAALGCLDCGTNLDMNFSVLWCKKVLPLAREVYTRGLSSSYPSVVHNRHLDRALAWFQSMVRGPAVGMFTARLHQECESLWKNGRRLCDAVSLTGRPCVHQVHDDPSEEGEQHSSGVVYLSACACGRSRRIREDPFDYESANSSFFQFPNCEELLQPIALPRGIGDALDESAWSLFRLGNAASYHPNVGLPQAGFCGDRNYLSRCDIPIASSKGDGREQPAAEAGSGRMHKKYDHHKKNDVRLRQEPKPEVPKLEESAFPPLPQKAGAALPSSSKLPRKDWARLDESKRGRPDHPMKDAAENGVADAPLKASSARDATHATLYVGFEHECPRGHRFFLSLEHLQRLGPPYSQQPGVERKHSQKRSKGKPRYSAPEPALGEQSRFQNGAVLLSDFLTDLKSSTTAGEAVAEGRALLNADLPIFMECPYCRSSESSAGGGNFAGTTSRLQRIFMVTPTFPLFLASCPLVQFDESVAPNAQSQLHFSFQCEVVLPPDSCLSLRLPFIYCTRTENGLRTPFLPKQDRPELTAWLVKGTAAYVRQNDVSSATTT